MDKEKVAKNLEECIEHIRFNEFEKIPFWGNCQMAMTDALALLKEHEKLKEKLLQNIADNQLTVSPTGYETDEELAKRTGEWNGLQMAYEIVLNDGN